MRKRPEVPKHLAKVHARKLLERQERANIYEKGLADAAKYFAAGSFFPVDVAEGVSQGALTPPASYKAAMMRPPVPSDYQIDPETGKPVFKGKQPVVNPEYKGTTEHVGKQLGVDIADPGGLAPQAFSPDPFAKVKALGILGKLGWENLAGLGALYGGLKKVGKGEKAEDVAKPIFTSPGKAAAADISKETIPANKVKNQLEGRGVSKDEMEWTGFNDWIKTKKGEVSKAEIEEFFEQNQIQVQEVVKGGKGDVILERQPDDPEIFSIYRADDPDGEFYGTVGEIIEHPARLDEQFDYPTHYEVNVPGVDREKFNTLEGAKRFVHDNTVFGDTTKYPQKDLQLPGGENYRELLLRVPEKKVPWTKENVVPISQEEYAKEIGISADSLGSNTQWFFKTPDGTERMPKKDWRATDYLVDDNTMPPKHDISQEEALEKILARQPDPKPRFTSGHWEESDVIAHIRFNERVDPDGNKVLFIEEIQSDWAHSGKDVGFKTAENIAARTELENIAMKRRLIKDKIVSKQSEIMALTPGEFKQKKPALKAEKVALQDELSLIQKEYDAVLDKHKVTGKEIQPGPFVTDAHQWTNLALKRMIRWASDEGFDSIAWVTGRQSAERYNVSKVVDEIEWYDMGIRSETGAKAITLKGVTPAYPDLEIYTNKEGLVKFTDIGGEEFKGKHIRDILGKGLGDKILSENKGVLKDADLDIGGQYHQFIYDKVLTEQAKKIGKKHGAKVEEGSIGAAGPEPTVEDAGRLRFEIRYNNGDIADAFETEAAAMQALEDGQSSGIYVNAEVIDTHKEALKEYTESNPLEKVWTMKLTDKLKEASREGLPYYMVLPPLVIGGAAAQRTDAQRQQAKTDAQAILNQ